MSIESPDMRSLTADLGGVSHRAAPAVRAVVMKGAVNIKKGMVDDARASRHFKAVAKSISFDTHGDSDSFEAEIGPAHGPGEPGNLANIMYFGTSRGGGTVRDPQAVLDEERPRFEAAIADAVGDLL